MKRKIFLAFILLVILGGTDWGLAEMTNRIVAIVNNDIITAYELEKMFRTVQPSEVERGNPEEIKKQLLFQMIDQKLVEFQVKRLGIQISSEEVDKTVERIRNEQGFKSQEDFAAALSKGGMTEAELKAKIKEQLQRLRLMTREIGNKIVVSDEKIKDYFEKNKTSFQKMEGVHLAQIVFPVSANASPQEYLTQKLKAEEIWERLKKGENFAEMAQKYSQGPTAAQGGDLGVFSWDEIDPSLREVISPLKQGEFSKVLPFSQGWQIVQVIAVQENKEVTLESVRTQIYDKLFREEVELRFGQWLKQLKDRSYIQVML